MLRASAQWPRWIAGKLHLSDPADDGPLRAELLSGDQLARHATALARSHRSSVRAGSSRLLGRLTRNEEGLRAFNIATLAVDPRRRITPAAEWLLDNFYLVEEQIGLARRHLPRSYSRELPRLLNGAAVGFPRVYGIVLDIIAHSDAQIDVAPLATFIAAYQTETCLTLGELWAIPIMLRLGLIENLHRITEGLARAREARNLADIWADRLQRVVEQNPSRLVIVVADMAKSEPALTRSFVAQFSQRLARQGPVLHLARSWLDHRLSEEGVSIDERVQQEGQSQAADQVSVSHSIASLRLLGSTDWKDFVEGLSVVDQTLRGDPSGAYRSMDFHTRDGYRHAVEALSRHSRIPEGEVAGHAVRMAAEAALLSGPGDRSAHVGFYLVDDGRRALWRAVRVRWPWRTRLENLLTRWPVASYSGAVLLATLAATWAAWAWVRSPGEAVWRLALWALAVAAGSSRMAVALVNWCSMLLIRPGRIPRLDFGKGIDPDCATLVAVPSILSSEEGIDRLVETLEIHQLSNRDPNLHFALLTDFRDAPSEQMPGDASLLARAREGIERLNAKVPASPAGRFFLFHRPRRWNPGEGVWMGYERKRGKLAELNALLRGRGRDRFSEVVGDLGGLSPVRYVLTLDEDTQLPRDAARELAGAMAHPLNRPVFDAATGVVTKGYGILQPRIGVSLPGARATWFARLYSGDAGIDPYTREVSDVYQDLFHEGSFIGKGIYEVDAFERALGGRFPENAVLSHDLLEACHARSALVSDVELFEESPSRYNVDASRRRRWIRGDWQICPWLLPRVPAAGSVRTANAIAALGRWKILDNLRRSLVPFALVALVGAGWLLTPQHARLGPMLVVAILLLPGVLSTLVDLLRKPADLPFAPHFWGAAALAWRQLLQAVLALAFMPYDAWVSADAIGRTLVRLLWTRRHLLQWRTSSDASGAAPAGLHQFLADMWIGPFVALAGLGVLAASRPAGAAWCLPIALLWFLSPAVAWWISRPIRVEPPKLSPDQLAFLGRTARSTWHFFETFASKEENWLPPDNFQEIPSPRVASRTSPTNIGLSLLANLAAADLGYVSAGGAVARTRDTFATLLRMERHRGHFYNWYDTRSLEPLPPRYLSSVDSGNLAGHLLTLGAGLREMSEAPILSPRALAGLRDTAGVLQALAGADAGLAAIVRGLGASPSGLAADYALLERTAGLAHAVAGAFAARGGAPAEWSAALERDCRGHMEEVLLFSPWLARRAGEGGPGPAEPAPTLREVSAWAPACAAVLQATPERAAEMERAGGRARARIEELGSLADLAEGFATMDFQFLFNESRNLFSTGYNVTDRRFDSGFYDLLASEARLCSYVAIALGQAPQDHWFSLGRLLVASRGTPVLVSWSGSMFEYLMPLLVMPSCEKTLLDDTYRSAVLHQISYARSLDLPWGTSESGYNRTDVDLNYQYRAFGVPGLGMKRGLAEDKVIAPYATALALMVAPAEACENLQRLASDGRMGAYGLYEAVDYTAERLPPDQTSVTIRSFMAHHQAMSLIAMANLSCGNAMQRRFMACPLLRAADLLLQERPPKAPASLPEKDFTSDLERGVAVDATSTVRVLADPGSPAPDVHLLSNGSYHVAVTSAGGGYSRWRDLAVTRWREDATLDDWGTFVFLRDLATGEAWSAAHQPTRCAGRDYRAIFSAAKVEFLQVRGDLEIHTSLCVSPEDDVELRRITLKNRSTAPRHIELTSYAEVVLATQGADAAHPAFGDLFVQTETIDGPTALLCTRRARSAGEQPPWMLHMVGLHCTELGEASCETDRLRFVGRGGTLAHPAAMRGGAPLSNTVGSVLDPIVSVRRSVVLGPDDSAVFDVVQGVSTSRQGVLAQLEKYRSPRMADRAFDLAWTHGQVTLRQLDATEGEAQMYGRIASALIYADPSRRAPAEAQAENRRNQSGLWSYGISGDLPLVVLRINGVDHLDWVLQLVKAHAFWKLKGLAAEMMILVEDVSIYRQSLHDQIAGLVGSGGSQASERAGGIFVRSLDQVPSEDLALFQASARVYFDGDDGTLAEQMEQRRVQEPRPLPLVPSRSQRAQAPGPVAPRELIFQNGLGGFTKDGHEYVITLAAGQMTPMPWINVIANPSFGTVVSEGGSAYTWAENSHEFRTTPWNDDPVSDTTGEALYLRDEQTGQVWSPTPLPARGATPYVVRHGFGYTVFEHEENGIASELWVYVAMDAPVKFSVVRLRNLSDRARRISATGYWEWVLGEQRQGSLLHVRTEVDAMTGALMARNPYNIDFAGRIAFADVSEPVRSVTGDRREFLGRNGSAARPAALRRARLSGKVGAGLDPCGAIQVAVDLDALEEREVTFRLGVGRSLADVQDLVQRFRRAEAGRQALEGVWAHWNRTLGAVNVDTPDASVNMLVNGWLMYQTISGRLWGRTGFYQSGGAYGFRDQLQDVMALVHTEPALTREHLLRAAGRQYEEGDVQHWWHPPSGRGVRTRFSDDLLWLPYATCRYVSSVADTGVLDERVGFLKGRAVKPEEESYYELPARSEETGTLYEHCVRAIERGTTAGVHGLPLMGCGDWNDGMNRVGDRGRGESVWLAFFLHDVLARFSPVARGRGDSAFADRCDAEALRLRGAIAAHGWDGAWYLRAFFDDGTPLGSASGAECQIDSLPQSWSVISGAGETARSLQAMESVDRRLARRDLSLVQLLAPPFDKAPLDPGYIRGYIPGVRENGGQYTQAALWVAMALAEMGQSERAWEYFGMLNPVHHSSTPAKVATYKVEPYVMVADIYAVPPHEGRGGWTWYTGSAGWAYRLLAESLLGIHLEGERLRLEPRMPAAWASFKVHYRYRRTVYHITFTRRAGALPGAGLSVDGRGVEGRAISLHDDQLEHAVELEVA